MSSPNSPSPSEGLYRASLSPKSNQYQLTPRSKVKALLAAIDDESSSERETSPSKRKSKGIYDSSAISNTAQLRNVDNDEEGSEEEDSDEGPIIPRGRLAARLYRTEERLSDSHASGEDNVYERIKHQLLPKATNGHQASSPDPRPNSDNNQEKNGSASPASSRFNRRGSSMHPTPGGKKSAKSAAPIPRMDSDVASHAGTGDGSDSDLPAEPQHDDRLKSLVARKKQEARARQMEKEQEAARRNERSRKLLSEISEDSANDQVGEGKLTQQARPTRKASKKALEEMNRETQRMSRNMQLAHQAKTKKKITKESFFSRFNFQSHAPASSNAVQRQSSSTVASSAPASDKEANSVIESPPTSPLGADDILHNLLAPVIAQALPANEKPFSLEDVEAVLPCDLRLVDHLSPKTPETFEKSKFNLSNTAQTHSRKLMKIKNANLPAGLEHSERSLERKSGSESDLEILPRQKRKKSLKIFDRMPTKGIREDRSLQTLRALAHLNSPGKQTYSSKPIITMSEMQVSLQKKARKQAAEERAAKIQDLKDRGIIVQTAEERERDQAAIEDLVEKARQEAALIMQKEKDAARKEKLASGEVKSYELSSDEDEEFEGDDEDETDIDLSGSGNDEGSQLNDDVEMDENDSQSSDEDEGEERENTLKAEPLNNVSTPQLNEDRNAQEERNHTEQEELEPLESDQYIDPDTGYENERPRRRTTRVIEDDEDDDIMDETGKLPACLDPIVQKPFIPGLAFSNGQAMGMTQAFAATMADLPSQAEETSTDLEQDSLALLGPMPEPDFPLYALEDSQTMVLDTQIDQGQSNGDAAGPTESSMEITLDFSQSQIGNMTEDSEDLITSTQFSEIPDPTQDVGFEKSSPIRNRFVSVPPSTVDTVILSGIRNSPPIVKKKGRLRRRTSISMSNDIEMNENATLTTTDTRSNSAALANNAFDLLKKGAKKSLIKAAADPFDKKQSEAKAMVEEQAQESEDEYAGLGGASDDESAGEEDEEVQKMIDEGEVDVDERELAAFYANKELANDSKAVEKLFKDLHNGGLRRKRGAEFDLSDSDDDGEARRRAKRREFAKMRKALFENERIGKIAEDPKKLAFLRAIEDREHDENYYDDLLGYEEVPEGALPSGITAATANLDDNNAQDNDDDNQTGYGKGNNDPHHQAPSATNPTARHRPHRPLQDSLPDKINRAPLPPPSLNPQRRSRAFQKPLSLADIRASVSFLLDEPDTNPLQHPPSSSPPASDNDDNDNDTAAPTHRNRNDPFTTSTSSTTSTETEKSTFIDRLSLKRAESLSTSTSGSSTSSRLAFHDRRTASKSQVPTLLRRATTSNLHFPNPNTNTNTTTIATSTGSSFGKPPTADAVRMGGTRKSSVGYFAQGRQRQREEEMREREKEKERKRREGVMGRGMGGGNGGVGVGPGGRLRALGVGSFE